MRRWENRVIGIQELLLQIGGELTEDVILRDN